MYSRSFFFFFNYTPTTEIYTLSLHAALPIFEMGPHHGREEPRADDVVALRAQIHREGAAEQVVVAHPPDREPGGERRRLVPDRKSTRLNSSHLGTSYAVFCLRKQIPRRRN